MPIVRTLREGEAAPPGYAYVRPRPEMLGYEAALIPFHLLVKFYHFILRSSHREWTPEEVRSVKVALEVMNERAERRYMQGIEKGREMTEEQLARIMPRIMQEREKNIIDKYEAKIKKLKAKAK